MECEQFGGINFENKFITSNNQLSLFNFQMTHTFVSYMLRALSFLYQIQNAHQLIQPIVQAIVPADITHADMPRMPASICFQSTAIFIVQCPFLQSFKYFTVFLLLFYKNGK